jgi:hypothetical protein
MEAPLDPLHVDYLPVSAIVGHSISASFSSVVRKTNVANAEVATVVRMADTFGYPGLLISSLMIGALVATIGYTPLFIGLGVFDPLGAALLGILVRERKIDHQLQYLRPS